MKDVGLRIRVQKELREQFLEACRKQDKPAAQVLREFMREYVSEQEAVKPDITFSKQRKAGENLRRKNRRSRESPTD